MCFFIRKIIHKLFKHGGPGSFATAPSACTSHQANLSICMHFSLYMLILIRSAYMLLLSMKIKLLVLLITVVEGILVFWFFFQTSLAHVQSRLDTTARCVQEMTTALVGKNAVLDNSEEFQAVLTLTYSLLMIFLKDSEATLDSTKGKRFINTINCELNPSILLILVS